MVQIGWEADRVWCRDGGRQIGYSADRVGDR